MSSFLISFVVLFGHGQNLEIRDNEQGNTPSQLSLLSFPPGAERAGRRKTRFGSAARTSAYLILGAQGRAPIPARENAEALRGRIRTLPLLQIRLDMIFYSQAGAARRRCCKNKKGARMQFCYELQSRPNWPSAVPIHCRLQYSDFIRPPYDALLHIRKGGRFSF